LTYVGSTARSIVVASGGTPSFGLLCFMYIFLPWQGFWNAIIYIRPRYMRNREKYPNMSILNSIVTEDEEYDHRLGARAMRSTRHSGSGGFFGSILRRFSVQGEGEGAEAEAEAELAQVADEGKEKA